MNALAFRRLVGVTAVASLAGLAACQHEHTSTVAMAPAGASPSAQLIGVQPAAPTGDPPGTTPVTANTTEVTKAEETTKKPSEGDNHSHSSLAKNNPQKAGGQDPQQQPERKTQ